MDEQDKPVECAGCGRSTSRGNGTTAGADTWWEVWPPYDVGEAAKEIVDDRFVLNACSPDCAVRAIGKLGPHYERLEEELVSNPKHIHEGGKG